MDKLIFLDIDGVIAIDDSDNGNFEWGLVDLMQKRLRQILEATNAKIVISSSWRSWALKDTLLHFKKEGFWFCKEIVGQTPRGLQIMDTIIDDGNPVFWSVPRGYEIDYYLDQLPNKVQYVILDDESDMLYNQRNNFLQTDINTGLTETIVDEAIKILNTPLT